MAPSRNPSSRDSSSRDSGESRKSSLSKYLPAFLDRLIGQNVHVAPERESSPRARSYLREAESRVSPARSAIPPRSRSPRPEDFSRIDPVMGSMRHDEAINGQEKCRSDGSRSTSAFGLSTDKTSGFPLSATRRRTPARSSDDNLFIDHHSAQPASRDIQNLVRARVDEYLSSNLSSLVRSEILQAISEGALQGQAGAPRVQHIFPGRPEPVSFVNPNATGDPRFDWLDREDLARRLAPFKVGGIYANNSSYANDYNEGVLNETDFHDNAFINTSTQSTSVKTPKVSERSHLSLRTDPWTLRTQIGSCPPLPRCGVPQTGLELASSLHSMDWIYANIQKNGWLSTELPCSSLPEKDIKDALQARMNEYQRRVSALPEDDFNVLDGLVLTLQRCMHYRKEVYIAACAGEEYELERCKKELQAKKKMGIISCEAAAVLMRDSRESVTKNKEIHLKTANDGIMKVIEDSIDKQLEILQRNKKSTEANPSTQDEGRGMEVDPTVQACTVDQEESDIITIDYAPVCEAAKSKKAKTAYKSRATKVEKKKPSAKSRATKATRCG